MEKVKIAIIGAGQVARTAHINHYQKIEDVEVVAVCDVNLEAAKNTAEMFGIPNYYDDHMKMLKAEHPDAVSVCVPNKFHCAITCDALNMGCHVLCEKPPAITSEEVRQMDQTAKEQGRHLTFGFHFRHGERVAYLKEMIEKQAFGNIYHSKVTWVRRRGIPGWGVFTNKEIQGGGPLIDIGAHMLDLAFYFLDYPKIDYVCASAFDGIGKQGGSGLMGDWDGGKYTVEDSLFGFIRFQNGTSLQIETAFALHMKDQDQRNVCLYGEKMGASLFPFELYEEDRGRLTNTTFPFDEVRDWHGDSIRNFIYGVRKEEALKVTGEQGVYVQTVIGSLYESAKTGKPVMYH